MEEEQGFKKGQKSYLKRFVNLFQSDATIALNDFANNTKQSLSDFEESKEVLINEIETIKELISAVEDKKDELQIKLDKISEFHTTIFEGDAEGNVISDEIEGFVDEFKDYRKEIDSHKEDIEKYKNELFGHEDEKGNEVTGLDHKIENLKTQLQNSIKKSQTELDSFYTLNSKRQEELFDKIEGLLKGASTVALAKAFKEHKDSFVTSNLIWMVLFVVSIMSMMGISLWGFINANYEFKDMWKYTLGNLPFIGGAIWLAIYSSKQRSQNKRLQQEYAFKEDVAKIYYGLKQEIEELGESELGNKLMSKMLETVLNVVSINPSETLDSKSHNDKGPIVEALNNSTEMIKKLKNPT